MKKIILTALIMAITLVSCRQAAPENPLLSAFDTPYGTPPFERIVLDDYRPAFDGAIADARAEIERIATNAAAPDFDNTIAALDRSGQRLSEVSSIFFNLNEAATSDTMQQIALDVSPILTAYSNDVQLDAPHPPSSQPSGQSFSSIRASASTFLFNSNCSPPPFIDIQAVAPATSAISEPANHPTAR